MDLRGNYLPVMQPLRFKSGLVLHRKPFGLGDAVAAVAQPIARAVDVVASTGLANCAGCTGPGGRKEKLNAIIPDLKRPRLPRLRRGRTRPA